MAFLSVYSVTAPTNTVKKAALKVHPPTPVEVALKSLCLVQDLEKGQLNRCPQQKIPTTVVLNGSPPTFRSTGTVVFKIERQVASVRLKLFVVQKPFTPSGEQ